MDEYGNRNPGFGCNWQKHKFIYGKKGSHTTSNWDVVGMTHNNDHSINTITTVYWEKPNTPYIEGIKQTQTLDEDWKNFLAYKEFFHMCNIPDNIFKPTKQYRVARMRYVCKQQLIYEILILDDGRSEDSYKEACGPINNQLSNIEKAINNRNVSEWENDTDYSNYTSSDDSENEEEENEE